jgi:hypothetical protein
MFLQKEANLRSTVAEKLINQKHRLLFYLPSQGYTTIGLKSAILARLQKKDIDKFHPSMLLP